MIDIPYKYRTQLKFKIEDWFAVKGTDKSDLLSEKVHMAWVVIKYQANCKIADTPLKTMNEVEHANQSSSKKNFAGRIRELSKDMKDHSKGGFYHLENVEKQIRDRRRKTATSQLQGTGTISPTKEKPVDLLSKTLTNKKQRDLGLSKSRSPGRIDQDRRITPDDLYAYTDKSGNAGQLANSDAVNARMAKEYAALQEDLKNVKARCAALEEGQMTVDNLQLAKQLEKEKVDQNKQYLKKIKELQDEADQLAADRKALANDRKAHQAFMEKEKSELDAIREQAAKLEKTAADRVIAADKAEEQARAAALAISKKEAAVNAKEVDIKERENRIAEYAAELEELKERLLQEREKALEDSNKRNQSKIEIEQSLKDLEQKKKEFEKKERDLMKELEKRERDIIEKEEKLKRDSQYLETRKSDIEEIKKTLDERTKRLAAQNEANEKEAIELMAGKNKLAADIRQWMADKR